MARDVIDLISSSPPPRGGNPAAALLASSPSRQLPPSHCPPRPTTVRPLENDDDVGAKDRQLHQNRPINGRDEWLLDDDFDMSDGLGPTPELNNRQPKRQRLDDSPRRRQSNVAAPPLPKPPPLRSVCSGPKSRAVTDPIEFTSSLDPDLPPPGNSRASRDTIAAPIRKTVHGVALHLSIDSSDPFGSSPPPSQPAHSISKARSPERAVSRAVRRDLFDQSSDPFASSPHPAQALEKARSKNNLQQSPSLFVSSPARSASPQPSKPTNLHDSTISKSLHSQKSKTPSNWDPIPSSSAPETSFRLSPRPRLEAGEGPAVISLASSSEDGSEEDEFPDLAHFNYDKPRPRARSPLRRWHSDVNPRSRSKLTGRTTTTTTAPKKTEEEKAREREAKALAREADKERKRLEKEQVKQAKAREKERAAALAEVNKARTDKKVSTPEMIVYLPSSMDDTIKLQTETLLDGLNVEHSVWECPVGNVIKWKRKVTCKYNEDLGRWEPIPPRIMDEKQALVIVTADELIQMALNDSLDADVEKIKEQFPAHGIVYLLEGVSVWMRKNRSLRNRQFTSGVRSQAASSSDAPPRARRRNNNAAVAEHISEDTIEDAMLRLQVEHDVLIHHTTTAFETVQWVVAFTQHISTVPYKRQKEQATSAAGFCMESGQVKTGEDAKDTYVRMLQEISRVTAPIAYGIAAEFDSVSKLVRGLEMEGPTRLEAVRKSANKDGAFSDRIVGQAVSRRMHKVFTGRDETSTDV